MRLGSHGTAAQIIAIGKTPGDDDQINIGHFGIGVPDHMGLLADHLLQHLGGITVSV